MIRRIRSDAVGFAFAMACLAAAKLPAQGTVPTGVPDPGVIATGQRVTPAGVQLVFEGRVSAVRFGRSPDEVYVASPGSVQRIAWRDGRLITKGAFDGRPGVHGMAIDPVTGRVLVATVGRTRVPPNRTPGTKEPIEARNGVRLLGYDGTQTTPVFESQTLGVYLAGGPAIAQSKGPSGERVVVTPLTADDKLAILDADGSGLIGLVDLGVVPVSSVISRDGSTAFVTVMGGAKPAKGARSATQCCDPRAEAVRIDQRGIALPGSVARVDVARRSVTATIPVGRHPTGIVFDEAHGRLYVAEGNDDAISIIDARTNTVRSRISVAPFREKSRGVAPTAVAISPDGSKLYVALGGLNAVAVYDVATDSSRFRGLIPTGWYPSSLDISADGRHLAVGTLLGVGSGTGTTSGSPGKRARYVHAVRGSVSVIDVDNDAELAAWTTAVARNNRLTLRGEPATTAVSSVARKGVVPRAVPERPGEASLIKHVVFIIKENRTYDQVLGDLDRGARDSSLVIYGREVTPNHHALAEQFVTLDHFFASGGNSADGHQWLTQANETEYPMWPLYSGRSYPFDSTDPLTYSSGGFLWEGAIAKGHRVSIFGEYAPAASDSISRVRAELMAFFNSTPEPNRPRAMRAKMRSMYNTRSQIPSLDRLLVREYPGWTMEVPDVVMAEVIVDHLRDWEKTGSMPNLVMAILPGDHTVGTSPGWCTPRACVADNDAALGRIVDALSHSRFWKDMAIMVVEDDAQNGVDHIDGHRTVAFAISPYARRGVVDSTVYTQPSMVKTIELMLGLPAMSMFDLVATDMRASFIDAGATPDLTPYTAVAPRISLTETNVRLGEITGPYARERKVAARASMRMRFNGPDQAPTEQLNRILWAESRGWGTAYPAIRQSVFMPMAVDIDDDDRPRR